MRIRFGRGPRPRRPRTRRTSLVLAIAAVGVALGFGPAAGHTTLARAAGSSYPTFGDTAQPEIGLPTEGALVFGASGQTGSSGEVWATGFVGDYPLALSGGQSASDGYVLLQHTDANGWQGISVSDGQSDGPLPGRPVFGAQSGRSTPDGGVALWSNQPLEGESLVTVNPGASTGQTVTLPVAGGPGSPLETGETLVPSTAAPKTVPFAAVDVPSASGNQTGVLLAPQNDGDSGTPGVLFYDPTNATPWGRDTVEDVPSGATFEPLALACGPTQASAAVDSPSNCYMLATVTVNGTATLTLYQRSSDANSPTDEGWFPQSVAGDSGLLDGTATDTPVTPLPSSGEQMLTVTDQGVWVDFATNLSSTPVSESELLEPDATNQNQLDSQGTWCWPYITGTPYCANSLAGPLTSGYLSDAWGGSGTGDGGERIISGGIQGTLLEFSGAGGFTQDVGTGDSEMGTEALGGAFDSPTEGFVSGSEPAVDGEGTPQVEEFTNAPVHDALTSDAVPFGSPLLAVASAPDTTPGDPNAGAFAVGVNGEVAQYVPGSGWTPESLLNSAGQTQTPTLRGVAWPEARRAYAVGDNGAMWVWQGDTGLWEPDPAKPFNFDENLTGIAFDPNDPDDGWAVGKDGTMLQFGKTWTQVDLPAALQNVDFTSVAFAGDVALATYRSFDAGGINHMYFTGGLAIDTGSGWVVDASANALLSAIPSAAKPDPADTLLSKVAGLPDGGAVAAGPGGVIETNNVVSGTWTTAPQPLPEAANISALAAYRQSNGGIGAIVSIEMNSNLDPNGQDGGVPDGTVTSQWTDEEPPATVPGGPPAFEPPDPFPDSGYLVEQTSSGSWDDMEHMTFPDGGQSGSTLSADVPVRPDPVLALLVSPTGTEGLAVGGQTGDDGGTATTVSSTLAQSETAGIMRFGAGSGNSTGNGNAQLSANGAEANFVLGGDAACVVACADEAGLSLAPDVSLTSALGEATQITGVRAFLDDGDRFVGDPGYGSGVLDGELSREATLLGGGANSTPVYVAPSSDVYADDDALAPFRAAMGPMDPADPQAAASGEGYYAVNTTSSAGGPVLLIVLDFSNGNQIDQNQLSWLGQELGDAKNTLHEPAIVMGADSLGFTLPDPTTVGPQQDTANAGAVIQALVQGGASAYLFDYPSANVQTKLTDGGVSIPAFGSGTLGYVQPPSALGDSLGSSATLVISVQTAHRNASSNIAPVTATAIPNIAQLAIDATDGTLLRRSQVALFDGLARRPLEGSEWQGNSSGAAPTFLGPQPYDPIPNNCQGRNCAYQIPEQFSFTSSKPAIGNFVEHDASSSNPLAVALGSNELPIADASSGLFCAFNPGTTTITLAAGDLTYSLPVTVQTGSVEYPCGTVPAPVSNDAGTASGVAIPQVHEPTPHIKPKIHHPSIPVTIPPAPVEHTATPQPARPIPVPHLHPLPPVPRGAGTVTPVPSIAPAPPAPAARPVPPSGTSQVPSNSSVAENIPAAQKEREKLAATQGVEAMAMHDPDGPLPIPAWSLPLMVLALAAGGAGLRSRSRGRDDDRFAWAGRDPRAGSQARARTWRRPPPGGGRR